jgi:hypothetical protein
MQTEGGKKVMEIQEQSFDTGVVTLNYAEGPATGSALVLLHGVALAVLQRSHS